MLSYEIYNYYSFVNDKLEEMNKVFEKSEITIWECRNCGHLVMGKKAPEICPTCGHSQSYFEIRKENY